MKSNKNAFFNILNEDYPKVLLIGNGLTRKGQTSLSWDKLIEKVCRPSVKVDAYKSNTGGYDIPYPILSLTTSPIDDKERYSKYAEVLDEIKYVKNDNINRLLQNNQFDAILTTNYSYETEYCFDTKYDKYDSNKRRTFSCSTIEKKDAKYLIHTYNQISDNTPGIWHIHGELRRKSSMILSLYEYIRYINVINKYKDERREDYINLLDNLEFKSWIDYFYLVMCMYWDLA